MTRALAWANIVVFIVLFWTLFGKAVIALLRALDEL